MLRIPKIFSAAIYLLALGSTALTHAAPGDVLESFSINNITGDGRSPTTPQGLEFYDGYLWVVDFGTDRIYRVYPNTVYDADEVTVLFNPGDSDLNLPLPDVDNPPINSDGNPIGSCFDEPVGTPQYCGGGGLTFAENFLWNASPVTDDIIKIDPVDGDNLESENALSALAFPSPTDMTFDGTHFWIVDWQSNTVNQVLPEDGSRLSSLNGPSSLPAYDINPAVTTARPFGITWDGQAFWVSDQEEQRIYRISRDDGSLLNFFDSPGADPKGLAWDGEFLWHVDQATQTIYKLESGVIPFGIIGCLEKNGRAVDGDVLLAQTAEPDQALVTDSDGCFVFPNFTSGVPIQVRVSETGVDEKPIITLTETSPGTTELTLIVGDVYSEPGYLATDTEDGNITFDVVATPDVINTPALIDTSAPTSYTVAYDVIDSAGNQADTVYRTVTVLVADTTPPTITLLGDNPLQVEQVTGTYSEPGYTATDDRDGDITASVTVTGAGAIDVNTAGTYLVNYDVSDSTGNAATTVTRTVNVSDTTPPVLSLTGLSDITLERGDVFNDPGATATDTVDPSPTVITSGSVSENVVGTYIITYDATDLAGNNAIQLTRTVNVVDTTSPTITLNGANPLNQELNSTYSEPGAVATDLPGETFPVTDITGTVDTSIAATYTLTYNYTDAAGNIAASVTRDVIVADTGAPTITLLGDNPLQLEQGTPYAEPGYSASDAIDGDLTASVAIAGDTVDHTTAGTYVITYNVVDSAGNPAPQVTRSVIVSDTTPPVIVLSGNANVDHELQTPYTDAGASASDNIDGPLTVTTTGTVDANTTGVYILTYNATDSSGNAAAPVTRTIDVADRTAPVISLLPDATPINHEVGTIFNDPGATATDIIDGDLTASIGVTGIVDANTIGTYTLDYNVSDAAGNAATTVTRTVNVVDTGAPAITILGSNPLNHELNTTYTDAGATALDAADGDLTASIVTVNSVDTLTTGTYTVTYDVTDSQGNPAPQQIRTVNVADYTPPVITLVGADPLYHEQGTAFVDPGATAADVIDGDISLNIVATGSVDINTQGTYTLSYNVSDAAGNAATTVTRDVIVQDTTIPVITLVGANPLNHEVDTVFVDPGATASDNIDGDISGSIGVTGTVDASTLGSYTLTYNVQDSSGNNATTIVRTVNVVDTGAPTITILGANPVNHELNTTYTDAGATASDAADGDVTASIVTVNTVDALTTGTYTVTYDVTDSQGNPAVQQVRTVNVADYTPPVITLVGADPLYHEQGTAFVDPGATAADVIDGDISLNIVATGSVDINTQGTYTLSYNVSDAAGNAATTVTRDVIVQDTTIPVITLVGANPLNHEVDTVFVDPGATASDNIDGDISGSIGVTGTVDASTLGSYTLTYNVQDSSGNNATTVVRTVNVVDTGAPTISLIGSNPVLHELQTPYTDAGATASDAADGDLTASIVVTGTVNVNVAATYTLSYDVTDSQSNAATTVTRDVIVADRTAPVITLLGGNPIQHEQGTPFVDPGATAIDAIDGDLSLSIVTGGSVNANAAGSYTLTYNVSDAAGNAATQVSRTVNVVDTTIPVITLIGSDPINHEVNTVFVDPGASASDNIDGDISANINVTGSVNASVIGTYILTYNVIDSSGNSATSVTRTVNVADTGAPVITITGANPVNHEINTTYTDAGATATDSVDGDLTASIVTVNNVVDSVAGTYTVTYDVDDLGGNPAAQKVRTVNVGDFTLPVITLIGSSTVNIEQGSSYTDAGATASDNVDGDLTASIITSGTVDPLTAGTYIISYDVTDAAGNAAVQVTRTVIVADTTAPVITLIGGATINHEQGTAYSDPGASATDNIDGDISGNVTISGFVDANVAGTYTLTYNVSDTAGNNATTVTRDVIVSDTTIPSISLIGANPLNHEQGTVFTDPGATASDNIDGDISASIVVTGTVNVNVAGTYTLSYNVSDSSGNAATLVTRDVIVADTIAPIITLTGSAILNHEQGASFTDPGATANDSFDGDITASIVTTGSVNVNVAGTYTLTYNVSDAAGNAATTVTRDVVVADTTIPVITLNGGNPINHEQGTPFTDPGAGATDNIDGDISASIVVTGAVNTNVAGSYTLTYNVADSAGNSATTVNRTVNVSDTNGPVITLIGANPINHEQGTPFTDPGATALDTVDGDVSASIIVTGTVNVNTAGTYTLSYDVVDSQSNAATTVTRDVIVADTTGPTITVNGANPLNHEQGTAFTDPGATANDTVDGSVAVVTTGTVDSNVAATYTLSYDASDAAGNNATTQSRDVIVSDTTAPVITLTGSATVNHEQGTAYVDQGATATDIVDGDVSASIVTGGSVNVNVPGAYILTYDVTDAAGNTATQVTRTVNVADNTIPVITLSGANPINHEQGTPYTDPGAGATDNIDGDISGSIVVTGAVNVNVAGTYTLSYNVSDSSGNNATTVTRDVIVADTTIPVITLIGADPLSHEQGTAFTDPGATATDNIDGDISASIIVSGTVDANTAGSYVLTYNVADSAGNNAVAVTRTVNVSDTQPPVITLIGASPFNLEQGTAYVEPGATATDVVDGSVSVTITGTVNQNVAGSYPINYDAVDLAGNNATTVTRNVIVADTIAPTITLQGGATVDHPITQLFVDPGYTANDSFDGDITANVGTTTNLDINTEGTYTIDYDVSDAAGNAATTQTRTVNVVTPTTVNLEAETATIGGTATVAATEVGFNGSGYIDMSTASAGEYLEFSSITTFAVPYDLTIRYAGTDSITVDIILNGGSVGQIDLTSTGGTGVWQSSAALTITPLSGTNTLRLNFVGASATNIDDLTITPQ